MSSGLKSGCVNHPSIEATGRCKQCGKPYCNTCMVMGPTGRFCSDGCRQTHETYVKRAAKLDQVGGSSGFFGKLMARVRKALVLGLALLIVAVALAFFDVDIPIVSNIVDSFR